MQGYIIGWMSGHSKWATIHRQKEVKDAKKGAAFTKLARVITIAVREGGGIGDPDSNFKLRLAVDKARMANMPKENINRAIEKGTGGAGETTFEQAVYEGFGPGGAAVMVEVATDNKQRSVSEIKNVFDRGGGTLGSHGSVGYMFEKKGYLLVHAGEAEKEDAALGFIDLGASDVEVAQDGVEVYCDFQKLAELKKKIESDGYKIIEAELVWHPLTSVLVGGEHQEKLQQLLSRLDELDDVQKVYTNANF